MARKDGYLGNQNIRRSNIPVEYTQDQIQEFVKCYEDPIYFIRTYTRIVNLDKGLINFDLWPFQERMAQTIMKNRFSICKLPRQSR